MTQYTLCQDLPIREQQGHVTAGGGGGGLSGQELTCWKPFCCAPPTRVCGAAVLPAEGAWPAPGSWTAAWTSSSCWRPARSPDSAPWSCARQRRSAPLQRPRRPRAEQEGGVSHPLANQSTGALWRRPGTDRRRVLVRWKPVERGGATAENAHLIISTHTQRTHERTHPPPTCAAETPPPAEEGAAPQVGASSSSPPPPAASSPPTVPAGEQKERQL